MYLTHVHREPRAIHFSFASALRYPTVCQLMYRDGSPVTAMLIPVHQWNRTFTFNRLNKRTYYRVRCGSDPAATLSSQSFLLSSTTYWMPPPPARSWLPGVLVTLVVVAAVAGVAYGLRAKRETWRWTLESIRRVNEEEVDPARQSLLSQHRLGSPSHEETKEVMALLDAQRWRCTTCQYLNPIEATECMMCHAPKEVPEVEEWKDDGWGDSEEAPEPTDFLAAQAVEPKVPPQIVRAGVSESEEESEESVSDPVIAMATVAPMPSIPVAPMPSTPVAPMPSTQLSSMPSTPATSKTTLPASLTTIPPMTTPSATPVKPIQPAKPTAPPKPVVTLKRESSEAAGVTIRQKGPSKGPSGPSKPVISLTKPAPIRIIPAGKGMKLGGAPPPRKPVVLKKASEVVKSDDLFAELGMNAQ